MDISQFIVQGSIYVKLVRNMHNKSLSKKNHKRLEYIGLLMKNLRINDCLT